MNVKTHGTWVLCGLLLAASGCDQSQREPSTHALVELTNKQEQLEKRKMAVERGLKEIKRVRERIGQVSAVDDALRKAWLAELDAALTNPAEGVTTVPPEGGEPPTTPQPPSTEKSRSAIVEKIVGLRDTSFLALTQVSVNLDPTLAVQDTWMRPPDEYDAWDRMQTCQGTSYANDAERQMRACRSVLTIDLTLAKFASLKSDRLGALDRLDDDMTAMKAELEHDIVETEKAVKDQKKKLEQSSRSMIYAIVGMMLILAITLLAGRRYYRKGELGPAFSHVVLPLVTVMVLVFAILLLGLSGKFESETLGTLIAGISGYVLGKNLTPDKPPKLARSGPSRDELVDTLIGRLSLRGVVLEQDQLARVLAEQDTEVLERWLERARDPKVTTAIDILAD